MAANVRWSPNAEKALRRMGAQQARRIVDAVGRLAESGVGDVKKLQGADAYRLRVGDYRILFDSDGEDLTVLHVKHRREAYR